MLKKGSEVIGLNVFTIRKGKKIENVDDIVYDPKKNKVMALLVDPGGWFADAKVIMFDSVKSIGQDAVIVESTDALKKASDVSQPISNIAKDSQYLTKTRIITVSGDDLGKVTDIIFDPRNGKVDELEVSQGGLQDIQSGKKTVKVEDIVTVGEDATIVKSYTEAKVQKQAKQKGITGAITKGREQVEKFASKAQETAKKTAQRARQSAYDVSRKAKEIPQKPEVKRSVEKARQKGEQLKETTKKKGEQLKMKTAQKMEEIKESPQVKGTAQTAKTTARKTKKSIERAGNKVESQAEELKYRAQEEAREDVLGKYVTKNIITKNNELIARKGEMITSNTLNKAKDKGVQDQIFAYSSTKKT